MTIKRSEQLAYIIYALVALAVLAPMLRPGFILTLDMVFTPSLPMPTELTSSYLFHTTLHVLNLLIPSDVLQKIMLGSILLLSSVGTHRLIRLMATRQPVDWGIYIASIFYAINPFTYSRFMAGQYAVLLGYALLPWLVRLLILFAQKPGRTSALKLAGLTSLIGVVSIHTLVAIGILVLVGAVIGRKQHKKYAKYAVLAIAAFILLSSYWLAPLVLGQNKTGATISSFTSADTQAFATNGGNPAMRLANTLRLQGFWAEGKNLYLLPQDRMMLWGLMALIIIGLTIAGAVSLRKRHPTVVAWLGSSALTAIILTVATWNIDIPLLAGLREPHKLVMLVALAYSLFLAFGINSLLSRLHEKSDAAYSIAAVLLLLLPFLYMRVMLWGFDGQFTPRQYPTDWSSAKAQLGQHAGRGKTIFLPWHQYMTYKFVGRVIASPAPAFFGKQVIVSHDPELEGASGGPQSKEQQVITMTLQDSSNKTNLAELLAGQDVRYILLAKDLDYRKYDYLNTQPHIVQMGDYPNIRIYKNQAWRQP